MQKHETIDHARCMQFRQQFRLKLAVPPLQTMTLHQSTHLHHRTPQLQEHELPKCSGIAFAEVYEGKETPLLLCMLRIGIKLTKVLYLLFQTE